MAFENVDTLRLKNAITQCQNSIEHSETNSSISSLSNGNMVSSSVQKTLESGLEDLIYTDYARLKEKLKCFYNLVDYIQNYKNKQAENERLRNQIKYNLEPYRWKNEKREIPQYDMNGQTVSYREVEVTTEDYNVTNQINNCNNKIRENEQEMDRYMNYIRSELG